MDASQINWSEIAENTPKDQDTRIQSGPLPEREYWILKAATAANKRKLTQNSQSLLVAQIRRHQDAWFDNIAFLAAQDGKTFEQKFIELATGKDDA